MSIPVLIRKTVPMVDVRTNTPLIDPKTKQQVTQKVIFVNPAKRYVKPFWQTTDPGVVTVAANGNSGIVPMTIDQSTGHFEVFYFEYEADGPFTIQIFDEGNRTFLMNRPVHINTIAGNGRRPFILPETMFINVARGTRQLSVILYDLSGASNDIQFAMVGRRFIFKEAPIEVFQTFDEYYGDKERTNLFFLTTSKAIESLAPNTPTDYEFRVTSDSFFEVIKNMAASDPVDANFNITLKEYGSGRTFSPEGTPIRRDLIFGNGQYPHIFPESYLFERDYRILAQITNLEAVDIDVYLTMCGRRIKYPEEVTR